MVTSHSGRRFHPATLTALSFGLLVTFVLFGVLRHAEQARSEYEFTRRVEARVSAVSNSFGEAVEAMRAVNLLMRSTGGVPDATFEQFALPLIELHPYLQALVVHRLVEAAERPAYEARRRALWPGFEIRQRSGKGFVRAAERPFYLVVDMAVPVQRNVQAHGYDVWSFAPHRALLQRAIDTDDATASGLVSLIEPQVRRGIVITLPLYRSGLPLEQPAQRLAALAGATEVVIDVPALIRQKLALANLLKHPGIEIDLAAPVDGKGVMEQVVRYGTAQPAEPAWWGTLTGAGTLESTRRFNVAGQTWAMTARMRESAVAHAGSMATLFAGLAFSLALAAYVRMWSMRAREVAALVDVRTADLRRTSETLRLYQRAIESSANAILLIDARDPRHPVEYVNPAFQRMRGLSAEETVGRPLEELLATAPDQRALHELRNAMRERREGHALLRLRRKDGSELFCEVYMAPVNDAEGRTEHFVIAEYDVTTAKRYEAELERRSRHDTLTGLANRVLLADRIEQAKAFATRHARPFWIVALDLDHFKYVNDSLGHAAGNALISQVGERISTVLRPTDTVARTGGDEFVLLLLDRAGEQQAVAAVNEVLAALALPFVAGGQRLHLTCSAGVAGYPADGQDADILVQHAEIAMYRAKEAGRNTLRLYQTGMSEHAVERVALVDAMRHAIVAGGFELYYQPQVDLGSGRVVGMEALIRWQHPQLGMMRPDRFIALAEDTGLIVPIGAWALRSACAQAAAWERAGHGPLRVGVNLSARQFKDAALPALVTGILQETGLRASCLELELTETLVMDEVEIAIRTMQRLKTMGVRLSIDDFGTGYSSLSYLKRFPADVLKIDQSFVRDIGNDATSSSMVAAIISLSHDLGMRVIAEGVETHAQLDFLRQRRCDEAQGYLHGRPVPAAEFERALLAERDSALTLRL